MDYSIVEDDEEMEMIEEMLPVGGTTQPLPIIEVGGEVFQNYNNSEETGGFWCVLRVTPPKPLEDDLEEGLQDFLGSFFVLRYVMTAERAKKTKKLHYHVAFLSTIDVEAVRVYFQKMFPECNSGHLYNLEASSDCEYAIAYALKDHKKGGFKLFVKGFTSDEINNFKKLSTLKYSKEEFMKELRQIEKGVMLCIYNNHIDNVYRTQREYVKSVCRLKASYDQNINWNWVVSRSETMMIRKYGDPYLDRLVRWKLEKISMYE